MRLESLRLCGYRNLQEVQFTPHVGVNIVFGDNAQGKTNLIEAIWMLTGAKSFRPGRERDLIQKGAAQARVEGAFFAQDRHQTAAITLGDKRGVQLNGVEKKSASALAGSFCCVVFSPAHLSIVKDGPQLRRRFLDGAICQIRPQFITALYQYRQALAQKNALIKDLYKNAELYDLLAVFDEKLCQLGVRVYQMRRRYFAALSSWAGQIYSGLSGGRETLTLCYDSVFSGDEQALDAPQLQQLYSQRLQEAKKDDLRAGYSTVGVHRDDLRFLIGGLDCRLYGSQGQQRSVALALKLAEGYLLREFIGETPVMLLDDVMSELDPSRQNYILNHLEDAQVFITCCDRAPIEQLLTGRAFYMKSGHLEPCGSEED